MGWWLLRYRLRCYERLKTMQKRVFSTAFFNNRGKMVQQVVKYSFVSKVKC